MNRVLNNIIQWVGRPQNGLLMLLTVLTVFLPHYGYADNTCTDKGILKTPENITIVSDITSSILSILDGIGRQMYSSVANGLVASGIIRLLLSTYIIIYGILFMFAAVQITAFDFIKRLMKLTIVGMLIGSGGELYDLMYDFFHNGTTEILRVVSGAMFGSQVCASGSAGPLCAVDELLKMLVAPKTVAMVSALATTGFYGPVILFIMASNFKSIMESILNAIWVYVMSAVVRTLLLGLAPLFIACLLFDQTRGYFNGWINQLVNASLQPICLFAFYAFFATILTDVIVKIVDDAPVCVTQMTDAHRGSPSATYMYRFKDEQRGSDTPYQGPWGALGSTTEQDKRQFPIEIFTIAVFFILAELAGRLNSIAVAVANAISSTATSYGKVPGMSGDQEGGDGGKQAAPDGKGGGGGSSGGGGSGQHSRSHVEQMSGVVGRRK